MSLHVQIHINGITKEKGCTKGSGKLPFSEFQAMDWNFQSVKYLHELVRQYGGRKIGVEKQNSKKGKE